MENTTETTKVVRIAEAIYISKLTNNFLVDFVVTTYYNNSEPSQTNTSAYKTKKETTETTKGFTLSVGQSSRGTQLYQRITDF